jgi:hypothetical protein
MYSPSNPDAVDEDCEFGSSYSPTFDPDEEEGSYSPVFSPVSSPVSSPEHEDTNTPTMSNHASIMPPPPPADMSYINAPACARVDNIYEVDRIVWRSRLDEKQAKKKGRGPTRARIPPSRPSRFATTAQTGGGQSLADEVKQLRFIASEDLTVRSKLPVKGVFDSRSKTHKMIEMMHRSTGTMLRVPEFLNKDGAEYPDKWDFNCWWCCHPFDTKPVGCPVAFSKQNNYYKLSGYFCSFNCARAWSSTKKGMAGEIGAWFTVMIRAIHKGRGEKLDTTKYKLEPAPSFVCLKSFGGHMDIETFRKIHCSQVRLEVYPQELRIVPFGYNIFEFPRDSSKLFLKTRPMKYRKDLSIESQNINRLQTAIPKKKCKKRKQATSNDPQSAFKKRKQGKSSSGFFRKSLTPLEVTLRDSKKKKGAFKMARSTPRAQNSIQSMMNLRFG